MNIESIIEKCGGIQIIATEANLTEQAIRLWTRNGIPEKHWSTLLAISAIRNTNISASDIFSANQNRDTDNDQ